MPCKIWGWENLSIALYSIYTHTLQVYLQLCKLNALCTVNDWLEILNCLPTSHEQSCDTTVCQFWIRTHSGLFSTELWQCSCLSAWNIFNTCVNLNFRAIHQHIPYIHIYIYADAWSMLYISLIWCYCHILKTSNKTNLTCLVCLQLWLVVTHVKSVGISEGCFISSGYSGLHASRINSIYSHRSS